MYLPLIVFMYPGFCLPVYLSFIHSVVLTTDLWINFIMLESERSVSTVTFLRVKSGKYRGSGFFSRGKISQLLCPQALANQGDDSWLKSRIQCQYPLEIITIFLVLAVFEWTQEPRHKHFIELRHDKSFFFYYWLLTFLSYLMLHLGVGF